MKNTQFSFDTAQHSSLLTQLNTLLILKHSFAFKNLFEAVSLWVLLFERLHCKHLKEKSTILSARIRKQNVGYWSCRFPSTHSTKR
jgi:hypothetical protein